MGNWNINIQGVGPHHNINHAADANRMADGFVRMMKAAGHQITSATFTFGGCDNIGEISIVPSESEKK